MLLVIINLIRDLIIAFAVLGIILASAAFTIEVLVIVSSLVGAYELEFYFRELADNFYDRIKSTYNKFKRW